MHFLRSEVCVCCLLSDCLIYFEESSDYTEVHKGYQNSYMFQCFPSFRERIRQWVHRDNMTCEYSQTKTQLAGLILGPLALIMSL